MSYLTTSREEGPYLRNWYPGLGEVRVLETFPRPILEFLADASEEDPGFIGEYLVPTLEMDDPLDRICCDLSDALMDAEHLESGLGDLGFLGKSVFKRIKKAVRRVHAAIAKKTMPKALQKIDTKVMKAMSKVDTKIHDTTKKVWKKYGNTIISVAGAVLAPFTGGASLAAAAALTAANTAYAKKRAADEAKKAGRKEAAQLQAEANASDRALMQQLDSFYQQNQAWFLEYGITPDKWAGMTLEQKIELINAGAEGRLPRDPGPGTPAVQTLVPQMPVPVSAPVSTSPSGGWTPPSLPGGGYVPGPSGGGYSPQGGGGGDPSSVWGGSGIGPSSATSPYRQSGGPEQPQQAQASMFGGGSGMLPMLAVAAAVLLSQGKKGGGSRRKRNPSRRRRW